MQLVRVAWALAGAALCCSLILLIHSRFLKEGQLAAGTCEIVTLDRDSSQPRRTIARQTARCACKKGQIAGTTRASPACVDGTPVIVTLAKDAIISGPIDLRSIQPASQIAIRLDTWPELGISSAIFLHSS
ncbi:Protein FAM19A5 [Bagarius yarrelli]|uniref:Protein FAM19A5 n=1 Tax=Bagarius yarrelli TaxID=175774 RepID=A0A556TH46_BAGYA|nr:Protein FAM19A5 [Bagarius yarrelli]